MINVSNEGICVQFKKEKTHHWVTFFLQIAGKY